MFGFSADDVFAVGAAGAILHFDGDEWTAMTSPTDRSLHGVWGSSHDDVWAVGINGTFVHYDGVSWQSAAQGLTSRWLRTVSGSAPDHAVAFDEYGDWYAWDGDAWSMVGDVPMGPTEPVILGSIAFAPDDVWATGPASGFHWDGGQWTAVPLAGGIGLCGTSSSDLWAVGHQYVSHYDGVSWTGGSVELGVTYNQCWAAPTGEVFVTAVDSGQFQRSAGQGLVTWRSGSTWNIVETPLGYWGAVWGSSANDVWISGPSHIRMHFDGSQWTQP